MELEFLNVATDHEMAAIDVRPVTRRAVRAAGSARRKNNQLW